MRISKRQWSNYIAALRKVNDKATQSMRHYLEEYGIPETQEAMDELIWTAYNLSHKYGEAAATLAAEWYDMSAELSGIIKPAAVPAPMPTYGEVAKSVMGTCKTGNTEIVASSVGRLVKMAGVDTTMQNALRDQAEWAWIPSGDTCAFCLTLASRGWQRAKESALKGGHAEHIHANCDCTYAIRFSRDTEVAGYDPQRYKDMYDEAEGRTSTDKINFLRREIYAENSEKINEQKRDNYEKRKERESSAAEELDV